MILLDTSGLFCLHNDREPSHHEARELFDATRRKLVHSYVLAEFVSLAEARRVNREASLTFAEALIEQPDVDVVWVDELLHRSGMRLLFDRLDKRYSLADAISFILMQQRGIREALTTDHHFEQAGFSRLL